MMVSVARISASMANQYTIRQREVTSARTDCEVREGFVDGEDVARRGVCGLFWRLQVVVRHDVIARIDALCPQSIPVEQKPRIRRTDHS